MEYQLFYLERKFKDISPEEWQKMQKTHRARISYLGKNFFPLLETLNSTKGSKLEKVVNYAQNHKHTLHNYLQDGHCELSNNLNVF